MRTMVPPSLPKGAQEIVKDRLYFASLRKYTHKKLNPKLNFFTIDNTLKYLPFFADFGPLNLGQLYRFCCLLSDKLNDAEKHAKTVVFYCRAEPKKFANAAYLIGAFQVICLGRTAADAFAPFKSTAFIPFRDASMGPCHYKHTVEHCLEAIEKAKNHKFLDFSTFNVEEYEFYERVECGDFNIIVPDKFLAFSGPNNRTIDAEGYPALTPAHYVPIFSKMGVSTIIRLNRRCYDRRKFTEKGFTHFDLIYPDGTIPPPRILETFLEICASATGIVAVHCKAGLGRTGTLIACYMMRFWGWTARECIAWIRICRPGSVIGPQQHYLIERERDLLALYKKDQLAGAITHPAGDTASLMPRALANPREASEHRAPHDVVAASGAGAATSSSPTSTKRLSRDSNGSWTRSPVSPQRLSGSAIKDLDFGDEDHFRAAPAAVLAAAAAAAASPLSQAASSAAMSQSFMNAARLGYSSRAENTPRNYAPSTRAVGRSSPSSRSSSTSSSRVGNKSKKDKHESAVSIASSSKRSSTEKRHHSSRKSSTSVSRTSSKSSSTRAGSTASTSSSNARETLRNTAIDDHVARRSSDGFEERVDALMSRRYVLDADLSSVKVDSRSPTAGLRPDQISQGRYLLNAKRGQNSPSSPPVTADFTPKSRNRVSSIRPTPIHKLRLSSSKRATSESRKHSITTPTASMQHGDDLWSAVTSTSALSPSAIGRKSDASANVSSGKPHSRSGARRRLFD